MSAEDLTAANSTVGKPTSQDLPAAQLTPEQRRAYLKRIGFNSDPSPTPETLRGLQRAHLLTVPFENLDIHLGRPITLEMASLQQKVVDLRRGGFCYELNGVFAAQLAGLGFEVTLHEARVYQGDHLGVPFDHLTLVVTVGGLRFLTDVGFGAFCTEPLLLDTSSDQIDEAGTFRIVKREDTWFDVIENGVPVFRMSPTPRLLTEFEPGCTFHQTSPESPFTRNTVCSLLTPDGRITLRERTLIRTEGTAKTSTGIGPLEIGPTLADEFGVRLTDLELQLLISRSDPATAQ